MATKISWADDDVPFPGFCRVMGHIMLQPWHTFQILTKRPGELAERIDRIINIGTKERYFDPLMLLADSVARDFTEDEFAKANTWYKTNLDQKDRGLCDLPVQWPLRNLWMGATCENQEWYNKRSSEIVECRAALHFLSLEPLLGPIGIDWPHTKKLTGEFFSERESLHIDWVIVGPETGPGRRPCDPAWIKSIVDQCQAAGVPVHVKAFPIGKRISHKPDEWPEWARVREFPNQGEYDE